jgi:hypothetical protein
MEIKKTSKEWLEGADYMIMDPDGWDRKNFDYSFNKEKITLAEYNKRLMRSTSIKLQNK